MVTITLICVGKIKEKYLKDAISEYSKRLSKFCNLEIKEVADVKTKENMSQAEEALIKDKEGERIAALIKGGSVGLSDKVIGRADYHLSFSKMTFPHQLMRVILLEQIYRSFKISQGEPYHK